MTRTYPKLGDKVKITPCAKQGGTFSYLIEHPDQEAVFEFGEEEYFICSRLNGERSLEEIRSALQDRFGVALDRQQLEAFVRKLDAEGFLDTGIDKDGGREQGFSLNEKIWVLFDPNRTFLRFARWFGRFFPLFVAVLAGAFVLALGVTFRDGGYFFLEWRLLAREHYFLPFTLAVIIAMNFLGEVIKGIACRYYGGQVHEFNLRFIYRIFPRFQCDITDTFYATEKPAQVRIILAAMTMQLMVWAVSVILWKITVPWSFMHYVWSFVAFSSFLYFIFNFNPLLHRDGYQLLRTWLDIYGLRRRGINYARSVFLLRPLPEPLSLRDRYIFFWYGTLSWVFYNVFWAVFLGFVGYFLVSLLKGVGACLFVVVLCLRFEEQLTGLFMRMREWGERKVMLNQTGFIRIRHLVELGLLLVLVVVMLLPYRSTVSGEFHLRPGAQFGIRAQVPGKIEKVFVHQGQLVRAGEPVARLDNRDQLRRLQEAQATYDNISAQLDLLKAGPKPEEIARAEAEVDAARTSLRHSEKLLRRQEEMYRNKAVSEKDYDEALKIRDMDRANLKVAIKNLELVKSGARPDEIKAMEAQLRAAEAELRFSRKDLESTTLVSPIDGRIISAFPVQEEGQYLDKGDLFAVVEDASRLLVDIQLPEADIVHVRKGADVVLKTWAEPGREYRTSVLAIAPAAYSKEKGRIVRALSNREWLIERGQPLVREGKVVTVLAELENRDAHLKTDMTGYAKIVGKTRPVYAVFFRWLDRFIRVEVWSWIP